MTASAPWMSPALFQTSSRRSACAIRRIGPVAVEAVVGQDRPDVAGEIDAAGESAADIAHVATARRANDTNRTKQCDKS